MPKSTTLPLDPTQTYCFRDEICDHIRIHRNTLARWIETRGFPPPLYNPLAKTRIDKHGNTIICDKARWLVADVLKWAAEHLVSRKPANDNISPEDRRKLLRFIDE